MRTFYFALLATICSLGWSGPVRAEIVIGFANPLSGPYALTGTRNRIAVEIAVRDLNDRGGVLNQEVSLAVADDACGLEKSLDAARQLIAANVTAVIGHMCSHSSLLAAGLYETADVLMITPGSTHPRLTEEGRGNVFRLIGRDDHQGQLAGNFLADRWEGDQIAILHDGSTYGEGLARETRKQLRAHGEVEAIYAQYEPGQNNYGSLVGELLRTGVDVLYIGGYGPDAGLILKTARGQDHDIQLIGGDGLGMDEFWSVAGKAGEGAVFTGRPVVNDHSSTTKLLAEFQRHGLGKGTGGMGAYAAVQVWGQAVEHAGTIERGPVATALRRGRFATVLDHVAFDHKGDLKGADWQWKVWSDGARLPISSDHPTY
ncbi:MAG: branched-chain amino acid ABC transporter substrate-binding protein [Alphaproteobacteria bacterium]|nr:branched-chain amino acid ABC transporter substrate-binding protein [Alphaproteobacteria bacterium]